MFCRAIKSLFCCGENLEGTDSDLQYYSFSTDIESYIGEQCRNSNGNLCRYNCSLPLCTQASYAFVEKTQNCYAIIEPFPSSAHHLFLNKVAPRVR